MEKAPEKKHSWKKMNSKVWLAHISWPSSIPPGVHRHQLPEHRLLLSEGREGASSEFTDRHLRRQLWSQPAHPQSRMPGQDFLRQSKPLSPDRMHNAETWHLQTCNHTFFSLFLLREQRERCEMRRGREARGEERMMLVSLHQWGGPLDAAFKEKKLMLWTFLCFSPANKSIVSSSNSSECTFFQTVDDHVTHPVLFIPETHISSLQRMVGPALRNPSLLNSRVSQNLCVP